MDRGMISRRYAEALYMYAQKHGQVEKVYHEVSILNNRYRDFPALRRVMGNMMLKTNKKVETIQACFNDPISKELEHFLRLLIRESREEFLQEICLSYRELFREKNNRHEVLITTAIPLDKETEQKIVKKLESYINGKVILYTKVNPALIGGYVILWDTYRLDAGIASRLKRIKRKLTEATNN